MALQNTENCTAEDCQMPTAARGYCSKHYKRWQLYRDVSRSHFLPEEQQKRFWAKIAITANTDKCWIWQAALSSTGYGQVSFKIKGKLWKKAHRIAYYYFYGKDPETLCVLHKCDNTQCVNPYHLFLGTQTENIADMKAKGRGNNGEKQGLSKLTALQVIEIKKRLFKGETARVISQDFNVSRTNIIHISKGQTWKHIQI